MKHKNFITIFFITSFFLSFAQAQNLKWNTACEGLLENSITSTLKLEKTLAKKKRKLSTNAFNKKIQDELMVVQLNAWVCAVSSDQQLGASVEEQFLKEYARKVQQKNL